MTTLTLNGTETLEVQESPPDAFQVEATYAPHGTRAPKHTHPHHAESFTVLAGTLRVGLGRGRSATEHDYVAGDSFDVPAGTHHHMWNPGAEPAVVRWTSTPAGRVEEFFTAMDRQHRSARGGTLAQIGVLGAYRDVMRPSSRVTRTAVRLLAPVARVLHH